MSDIAGDVTNTSEDGLSYSNSGKHVDWTTEHENILIEWADKAMCYRWLHSKSNQLFSRRNAWYTIPVIVISTLTGTANFAQERVPLEYQGYFSMIVGGFNIVAGIITTVQQFLKITQLNEAHRVSGIAWDKFYRNIKIEIEKHPDERIEVRQMIKMSKEEFDRLMETSPIVPEKIIEQFKTNFVQSDEFKLIAKPEICDMLIPTEKYRNPWHNAENQARLASEASRAKHMRELKHKRMEEMNRKTVHDFITQFQNLNNRTPMESEVVDNLKDSVDADTIHSLMLTYASPV
jgi:hypothetical protein